MSPEERKGPEGPLLPFPESPNPVKGTQLTCCLSWKMLPVCVKELSVSGSCTNGMVPSHPTAHAPSMLMTTLPGGPQAASPKCTTAHSSLDNGTRFLRIYFTLQVRRVCAGAAKHPKAFCSHRSNGRQGQRFKSRIQELARPVRVCTVGTVMISSVTGPEASGSPAVCVLMV